MLNKPAGIAVHGGSGINLGGYRITACRPRDQDNLELVHRLDRDTSGCLLIAKRRPALRKLHECFREGEVHKRYYKALLLGRGAAATGILRSRYSRRNAGEANGMCVLTRRANRLLRALFRKNNFIPLN